MQRKISKQSKKKKKARKNKVALKQTIILYDSGSCLVAKLDEGFLSQELILPGKVTHNKFFFDFWNLSCQD